MKKLGHVPALDGMRGVAILLVLGIHGIGQPYGGYLGVPMFYVLSGFLITTLLLEQTEQRGISLRRFYGGRARRLGPALLAALAGYLVLSAALGSGAAKDHAGFDWALRSAGVTLAYGSNIAQYVASGHHKLTMGLGSTATLSQEEQFYLLWPIILIAFMRRPKALLAIIGLLVVWVGVHRAQLAHSGVGWQRIEAAPDCTADELLVGCGLALLRWHGWLHRPRHAHAVVISALAVSFVLTIIASLRFAWSFELGVPLFVLAIAILVVAAAEHWDSEWSELASLRPLRWMGRISYAAYLWDGIILWATPLHGLLGTAVVIALAAISTRFVEDRFRRHRPQPLNLVLDRSADGLRARI